MNVYEEEMGLTGRACVFPVYRFEFALHSSQKQICQGHLNKPRLDSRGAFPNVAKCFWPCVLHSAHLAGWKERIHALLNQVCLKEYINSNTSFSFESGRVEVRAHIIRPFKGIHLIFLYSERPVSEQSRRFYKLYFSDSCSLTTSNWTENCLCLYNASLYQKN